MTSSDIEVMVDFDKGALYDNADKHFDLKKSFENLINREVDLLENRAVKNPFLRKSIDSSK